MSNTSPQRVEDHHYISVGEDYEVRYWTQTLDCNERQLRNAIEQVGNSAQQVRSYLQQS